MRSAFYILIAFHLISIQDTPKQLLTHKIEYRSGAPIEKDKRLHLITYYYPNALIKRVEEYDKKATETSDDSSQYYIHTIFKYDTLARLQERTYFHEGEKEPWSRLTVEYFYNDQQQLEKKIETNLMRFGSQPPKKEICTMLFEYYKNGLLKQELIRMIKLPAADTSVQSENYQYDKKGRLIIKTSLSREDSTQVHYQYQAEGYIKIITSQDEYIRAYYKSSNAEMSSISFKPTWNDTIRAEHLYKEGRLEKVIMYKDKEPNVIDSIKREYTSFDSLASSTIFINNGFPITRFEYEYHFKEE